MEKLLNENDRIRRAEEIYYRRKNGINITKDNESKEIKKRKKNYLFQTLLLINLIIVVYAIQNKEYIFSEQFLIDSNNFINQEIDINGRIDKIKQYFQDNMYVVENVEEDVMQASNENSSGAISENFEENNYEDNEVVKENSQDTLETENLSSVSQMDIDIERIKEKYEFIWPLSGTITSNFGIRNSENNIITKYHTGVDIAAITGTKIIAAMQGNVIKVSDKGSYGKHIKIQNDDIITLYAHCNQIYVKEGDIINQGQEIAEVGTTGNSTGPHLHFEIRREERYIDPISILQ